MARKRKGLGGTILLLFVVVWFAQYIGNNTDNSSTSLDTSSVGTDPFAQGVNSSERTDRLPAPTQTFFVTATTLNVRQGPATNTNVLSQVSRGNTVRVTRVQNGWAQLALSDGAQGWVSAEYLSLSAPPPPQTQAQPAPVQAVVSTPSISRAEAIRQIIRQSMRSTGGSCPCPFNTDRAGRRCGGRSAYSRPGGASPICYENQVTSRMIENYRARN